jgi:antitoxin ParD1/3/4
MGTLSVNLTDRLERLVREKVDSGLYNSASEVVREALRLMDKLEQSRTDRLEQMLAGAGEFAHPNALRSAVEVHPLKGKVDVGIESISTNA